MFYSEAVSKCAGHAMRWLLSAYEGLESVDMKSSLHRVGYDQCWDCPAFGATAFARFGPDQQIPVPDKDLCEVSRNEGGWDYEDKINQELVQLAEYDVEPGQEHFFGEVLKTVRPE